ncbi:sigma-54 dependent transcriptional regulator [Maribacter sp. PR1]|uniref:Sigma-54 dependent transcriptional regulator n=1 Tax=Maribacter cobaltidurans TaxID=1178778 RepID=A0ABU7ISQ3_9FLAO|nr:MULTISPECIES: sigma-54 dependent transcriptional regulator [Maribacter]MDC6388168.1 sigma-54 dependent transcriptional regulator [Maribacter sp. PR1]MEE1975556.1 sigma-54 dependent transcriptional regulator [Maribacter cobaltidurans]
MPKILIIEDDTSFAQMLQKFLSRNGFDVILSSTGLDGEKQIEEHTLDVILTDLRLPDYDGIQLINSIQDDIPVIVMTGYAEVQTAVEAMKQGAYDYVSKPFTPDQILSTIENALKGKGPSTNKKTQQENKTTSEETLSESVNRRGEHLEFVSAASEKLQQYISLVAPTDMSVLITGDSGTGKEVTAKSIHSTSKRNKAPFIALDCGAIPKELAASEFFGHLKGSFTGAISDKVGSFEAANGGTLFLDEVGNLSYENQIQLLRALQERKIKRIGSNKEINVDVRIISATNEDLKEAVGQGDFREDLYHRLNEFSLKTPSLVNRMEDLSIFSKYFLSLSNQKLNKNVQDFNGEVWEIFKTYHWPGNIRELQNVIQRAVLLTEGDKVISTVLPIDMLEPSTVENSSGTMTKEEFEKDQIIRALKRTNYNKSKAAKLLQVTRKTLYNRINHYNLDF